MKTAISKVLRIQSRPCLCKQMYIDIYYCAWFSSSFLIHLVSLYKSNLSSFFLDQWGLEMWTHLQCMCVFFVFWSCYTAYRILAPQPGIEPRSLQWQSRVLTAGPPGNVLCVWIWVYVCICVLSRFSHVWLFESLWTVAHQAPLSMGFSSQEYWSGLPCPSPGDLPNPRIEPASLPSPS